MPLLWQCPCRNVYDSLSKGCGGRRHSPLEALEGWKLGEVVKYTTETYSIGYTSAFYVIINKQKWDAIPPDRAEGHRAGQSGMDREDGERPGMRSTPPGPAFTAETGRQGSSPLSKQEGEPLGQRAVQPVLDDYVKMTKEKGLLGDQVLKFAQDYLKQYQK